MKTSLRKKLMIVLLLATILPISISMIITYQRTTTSLTEQAIAENTKLLYHGKTNLANYFSLLNKLFNSVYFDASADDTIFRILRDGELPQGNEYEEQAIIRSTLRSMAMTNPDIYQIRLSVDNGNVTYLVVNDLLRSEVGARSEQDQTIQWSSNGAIQSTHLSHTYGLDERMKFTYYFPKPVISFHRPILDIPSDQEIGRLSIDITLDYIRSISDMLYVPNREELYILSKNGDVIFSSNEDVIGQSVMGEGWAEEVLHMTNDRGNFQLDNTNFNGIIAYHKLTASYMDWTIVKRIPYEHLYSSARQITRINSLVLGCFLFITVIATIFISYRVTEPIKRLIHSITRMQSGNLHAEITIRSQDEIGVLARQFRKLMDQINHLILREYRLEIANKTYQLKALQAQVHPHFLYNALQSIGTLALTNQDRKLYKLISSLGKLMRYHMNSDETVVTFKREFEHVNAYLDLQKQRFADDLIVHIELDSTIGDIMVPKMIIQPLVENIFKHGMNQSKSVLQIAIACYYSSNHDVVISVKDNGRGITRARKQQLQEQLDQAGTSEFISESEHIGLINVLMRLRLFFDFNTAMILQGEEEGGFSVRIHIPRIEGDQLT